MKAFTRTNLLLAAAVIALAVAPVALGLGRGRTEPFTGSDSWAQAQITADHPEYQPWFHSLFQPPSAEVESALFALQAALGAGFLGYFFGVARTKRRLAPPEPKAATAATGTASGDTADADQSDPTS